MISYKFYSPLYAAILWSSMIIFVASCEPQVVSSCEGVDLNNRPIQQIKITGLQETQHIFATPGAESGIANDGAAILFSQYRLNVVSTYTSIDELTAFRHRLFALLPINSAHACSLAPIFRSNDNVLDLNIVSDTNYDETHAAGQSLTDLFDIRYEDENGDSQQSTLKAFIESSPRALASFSLELIAQPATNARHRFTITYTLAADKVYSITTGVIQINAN